LSSGAGSDLLDGGEGPDTFLFTSVADSGLGPASDRIRDFDPGEDLIDLEAVAPGA
jgi:Ca2+-binding RTX toxin-like protein